MYAICIEASHKRGMGHFFRAINICSFLKEHDEQFVVLINNNLPSVEILEEKRIPFEVVDYDDMTSFWEKQIVEKYNIDIWVLDRYATSRELAQHVKQTGVLLVGIDDCGDGAEFIDVHFCGMLYKNIKGKKIYQGKEYIILNSEIEAVKRKREKLKKIIVTLGGSDTYGVTIRVVKQLKELGYGADIVVGPNFQHMNELQQIIDKGFSVYQSVDSLIKLLGNYDFAITGGGVTCFETSAMGLPSLIVANEMHEIETGKYVEQFGGAVFVGHYKRMQYSAFELKKYDIETMSQKALEAFDIYGMERIYRIIQGSVKK